MLFAAVSCRRKDAVFKALVVLRLIHRQVLARRPVLAACFDGERTDYAECNGCICNRGLPLDGNLFAGLFLTIWVEVTTHRVGGI